MSPPSRPGLPTALVLALLALGLACCATTQSEQPPPPPAPGPALPPAFPPQDIVGRWGLAAYHKDEDRARIEVAAAGQCKQPYIITLGPTGGVMMHLADQAKPEELRLKGAPGNKTYIGPDGERRRRPGPAGGVVRRPRADPALDGFGSAGPLRHHGLCALRPGGRKTRRQAEGQAQTAADPATKAGAVTIASQSAAMTALRDFIVGPWRAVPVLGVTQILAWGSIFYTPVLIVPLIAAERGWSISFAMGGFSVGLLLAGLSAPYVGRSIDRFGGHMTMTLGSLLGALGLVLIVYAEDRIAYLAVWMVLGIAMSASLYDSAFATLGRIFGAGCAPADHRADAGRRLCLDRELAGDACADRGGRLARHLSGLCRSAGLHLRAVACLGAAARPRRSGCAGKRRDAGAGQGAAAARTAVHSGGVGIRGLCLRSLRPVRASAGDLRALRHRCRNGGLDRRAVRAGAGRRPADRIFLRPRSASAVGGALRAQRAAVCLRDAGGASAYRRRWRRRLR